MVRPTGIVFSSFCFWMSVNKKTTKI